jgi:hypothetical protein
VNESRNGSAEKYRRIPWGYVGAEISPKRTAKRAWHREAVPDEDSQTQGDRRWRTTRTTR